MDKAKLAARQATLYLGGHMEIPRHAMIALMNMRAFWLRVTPDFDKSSMGQALGTILNLLMNNHGRQWMDIHQTKVACANLLVLIHDSYRYFFEQANEPDLLRARLDGTTIDPTNWAAYLEQARHLLIPFQMAINGMRAGDFGTVPRFLEVLWPRDYANQPPAKRQALGPSPLPPKNGPPKKTTKPPPRPTNRDDNHGNDKGFLVWQGGKLPSCPVFITTKDGKSKERLCMFFACQSQTCRHRPCNHIHYSRFDMLPVDAQKELIKFVNNTDGLEFAPKVGPTAKPAA
jgi:hypothetical protein